MFGTVIESDLPSKPQGYGNNSLFSGEKLMYPGEILFKVACSLTSDPISSKKKNFFLVIMT